MRALDSCVYSCAARDCMRLCFLGTYNTWCWVISVPTLSFGAVESRVHRKMCKIKINNVSDSGPDAHSTDSWARNGRNWNGGASGIPIICNWEIIDIYKNIEEIIADIFDAEEFLCLCSFFVCPFVLEKNSLGVRVWVSEWVQCTHFRLWAAHNDAIALCYCSDAKRRWRSQRSTYIVLYLFDVPCTRLAFHFRSDNATSPMA